MTLLAPPLFHDCLCIDREPFHMLIAIPSDDVGLQKKDLMKLLAWSDSSCDDTIIISVLEYIQTITTRLSRILADIHPIHRASGGIRQSDDPFVETHDNKTDIHGSNEADSWHQRLLYHFKAAYHRRIPDFSAMISLRMKFVKAYNLNKYTIESLINEEDVEVSGKESTDPDSPEDKEIEMDIDIGLNINIEGNIDDTQPNSDTNAMEYSNPRLSMSCYCTDVLTRISRLMDLYLQLFSHTILLPQLNFDFLKLIDEEVFTWQISTAFQWNWSQSESTSRMNSIRSYLASQTAMMRTNMQILLSLCDMGYSQRWFGSKEETVKILSNVLLLQDWTDQTALKKSWLYRLMSFIVSLSALDESCSEDQLKDPIIDDVRKLRDLSEEIFYQIMRQSGMFSGRGYVDNEYDIELLAWMRLINAPNKDVSHRQLSKEIVPSILSTLFLASYHYNLEICGYDQCIRDKIHGNPSQGSNSSSAISLSYCNNPSHVAPYSPVLSTSFLLLGMNFDVFAGDMPSHLQTKISQISSLFININDSSMIDSQEGGSEEKSTVLAPSESIESKILSSALGKYYSGYRKQLEDFMLAILMTVIPSVRDSQGYRRVAVEMLQAIFLRVSHSRKALQHTLPSDSSLESNPSHMISDLIVHLSSASKDTSTHQLLDNVKSILTMSLELLNRNQEDGDSSMYFEKLLEGSFDKLFSSRCVSLGSRCYRRLVTYQLILQMSHGLAIAPSNETHLSVIENHSETSDRMNDIRGSLESLVRSSLAITYRDLISDSLSPATYSKIRPLHHDITLTCLYDDISFYLNIIDLLTMISDRESHHKAIVIPSTHGTSNSSQPSPQKKRKRSEGNEEAKRITNSQDENARNVRKNHNVEDPTVRHLISILGNGILSLLSKAMEVHHMHQNNASFSHFISNICCHMIKTHPINKKPFKETILSRDTGGLYRILLHTFLTTTSQESVHNHAVFDCIDDLINTFQADSMPDSLNNSSVPAELSRGIQELRNISKQRQRSAKLNNQSNCMVYHSYSGGSLQSIRILGDDIDSSLLKDSKVFDDLKSCPHIHQEIKALMETNHRVMQRSNDPKRADSEVYESLILVTSNDIKGKDIDGLYCHKIPHDQSKLVATTDLNILQSFYTKATTSVGSIAPSNDAEDIIVNMQQEEVTADDQSNEIKSTKTMILTVPVISVNQSVVSTERNTNTETRSTRDRVVTIASYANYSFLFGHHDSNDHSNSPPYDSIDWQDCLDSFRKGLAQWNETRPFIISIPLISSLVSIVEDIQSIIQEMDQEDLSIAFISSLKSHQSSHRMHQNPLMASHQMDSPWLDNLYDDLIHPMVVRLASRIIQSSAEDSNLFDRFSRLYCTYLYHLFDQCQHLSGKSGDSAANAFHRTIPLIQSLIMMSISIGVEGSESDLNGLPRIKEATTSHINKKKFNKFIKLCLRLYIDDVLVMNMIVTIFEHLHHPNRLALIDMASFEAVIDSFHIISIYSMTIYHSKYLSILHNQRVAEDSPPHPKKPKTISGKANNQSNSRDVRPCVWLLRVMLRIIKLTNVFINEKELSFIAEDKYLVAHLVQGYYGTMMESDRLILRILFLMNQSRRCRAIHTIQAASIKPLQGQSDYGQNAKQSNSFWTVGQKPYQGEAFGQSGYINSSWMCNTLDLSRIHHTIASYPLWRHDIIPNPIMAIELDEDGIDSDDMRDCDEKVYDPCYWIPCMLYELLSNEISIRKLASCGGLSLILAATSDLNRCRQSFDKNHELHVVFDPNPANMIQTYAMACLAKIKEYCDSQTPDREISFRERPQIAMILNYFQNSISSAISTDEDVKDPKQFNRSMIKGSFRMDSSSIPCLISLFLAQAVLNVFQPSHDLYLRIGKHFLLKPYANPKDVPLFESVVMIGDINSHSIAIDQLQHVSKQGNSRNDQVQALRMIRDHLLTRTDHISMCQRNNYSRLMLLFDILQNYAIQEDSSDSATNSRGTSQSTGISAFSNSLSHTIIDIFDKMILKQYAVKYLFDKCGLFHWIERYSSLSTYFPAVASIDKTSARSSTIQVKSSNISSNYYHRFVILLRKTVAVYDLLSKQGHEQHLVSLSWEKLFCLSMKLMDEILSIYVMGYSHLISNDLYKQVVLCLFDVTGCLLANHTVSTFSWPWSKLYGLYEAIDDGYNGPVEDKSILLQSLMVVMSSIMTKYDFTAMNRWKGIDRLMSQVLSRFVKISSSKESETSLAFLPTSVSPISSHQSTLLGHWSVQSASQSVYPFQSHYPRLPTLVTGQSMSPSSGPLDDMWQHLNRREWDRNPLPLTIKSSDSKDSAIDAYNGLYLVNRTLKIIFLLNRQSSDDKSSMNESKGWLGVVRSCLVLSHHAIDLFHELSRAPSSSLHMIINQDCNHIFDGSNYRDDNRLQSLKMDSISQKTVIMALQTKTRYRMGVMMSYSFIHWIEQCIHGINHESSLKEGKEGLSLLLDSFEHVSELLATFLRLASISIDANTLNEDSASNSYCNSNNIKARMARMDDILLSDDRIAVLWQYPNIPDSIDTTNDRNASRSSESLLENHFNGMSALFEDLMRFIGSFVTLHDRRHLAPLQDNITRKNHDSDRFTGDQFSWIHWNAEERELLNEKLSISKKTLSEVSERLVFPPQQPFDDRTAKMTNNLQRNLSDIKGSNWSPLQLSEEDCKAFPQTSIPPMGLPMHLLTGRIDEIMKKAQIGTLLYPFSSQLNETIARHDEPSLDMEGMREDPMMTDEGAIDPLEDDEEDYQLDHDDLDAEYEKSAEDVDEEEMNMKDSYDERERPANSWPNDDEEIGDEYQSHPMSSEDKGNHDNVTKEYNLERKPKKMGKRLPLSQVPNKLLPIF